MLVSTEADAYFPNAKPTKLEDRVVCVATAAIKPDMTIVTPGWRVWLDTDKQCPEGELLVILPEIGPSPPEIDPHP
ncbi:MAG: hypothetical protein WDN69_35440 [Aliidongia sp.]